MIYLVPMEIMVEAEDEGHAVDRVRDALGEIDAEVQLIGTVVRAVRKWAGSTGEMVPMTSTYKLTCPDCGHDASRHLTDGMGHYCAEVCGCRKAASSLYAAECERLTAGYKMCVDERDAARAECERLRTVEKWARQFVAQEESAMGDVNDGTHAYQQLRTALDGGPQ